jgi:hypothetical protein
MRTGFNADECTGSACKAKNDRKREITPHHVVLEEREDVAGRVTPITHDPQWHHNREEPSNVEYDNATFYQW